MNKITNKTYRAVCLAAVAAGLVSSAHATVDYSISDGGLETVNVNLDGSTYNGILAGGIKLTSGSSSYVSVCTDFLGSLYLGSTYTYNNPVSITTPGLNGTDPSWGEGAGAAAAAIENAAKIFGNNYAALQSSTTSIDEKAAIQIAIWTVLYDTTTSTLDLDPSTARFSYSANGTVEADVTSLLNNLAGYALGNPQIEVLVPDSGAASFTSNPDGHPPQGLLTPVPEASTIVAGGLLLLPFALGGLKAVRKSRV
jgi:hypothetical protein